VSKGPRPQTLRYSSSS